MTKEQAISLFGNKSRLAAACGCSRQAIDSWTDPISPKLENRVIGAAIRVLWLDQDSMPMRHCDREEARAALARVVSELYPGAEMTSCPWSVGPQKPTSPELTRATP